MILNPRSLNSRVSDVEASVASDTRASEASDTWASVASDTRVSEALNRGSARALAILGLDPGPRAFWGMMKVDS